VESIKSTMEPAEPTTESWAAKATATETAAHSATETAAHSTVEPTTATVTPAAALSDCGQCQEAPDKEKLR
jgi:hypothetical protein